MRAIDAEGLLYALKAQLGPLGIDLDGRLLRGERLLGAQNDHSRRRRSEAEGSASRERDLPQRHDLQAALDRAVEDAAQKESWYSQEALKWEGEKQALKVLAHRMPLSADAKHDSLTPFPWAGPARCV